MSQRALVTGGGGFLGRAIVGQLLEQGDEVRVFSRRRFPDLEAVGVESQAGDLADPDAVAAACRGRDVVYHVAALAGAWGPRGAFERTTVLGTRNVIQGCRSAGVAKLVHTSSPSVVATPDGSSHEGVNEDTPYPETFLADYPRTKAQAERDVLAANGKGLLTCALRPHLIVGPGDPHLIPRLIRRAKAGRLRIVGRGDNKVDITWVDNAARAHVQAGAALKADGPVAGSAYFISNGEPVELWPWIQSLLEGLGLPRVTKRISFRAAYRLGRALETAWRWLPLSGEPPMTRFVATQLASSHWFDISRARRDLGYDPDVFPMAQVQPRLFAYFLEGEGKTVLER